MSGFKTWQVFFFSLIPLALVFIGVVGGSMDGSDSDKEIFPTPAPQPTSSASSAGGPAPAGATALTLTATNLSYDKRALTVASARPVSIAFSNQDSGQLHNVAIYTNRSATQKIFGGDFVTGPGNTTYNFTAPPPGSYFFRCDTHPDTMTGTFTSR